MARTTNDSSQMTIVIRVEALASSGGRMNRKGSDARPSRSRLTARTWPSACQIPSW